MPAQGLHPISPFAFAFAFGQGLPPYPHAFLPQ